MREADEGVVVEAMDPGVISTLTGSAGLEPIVAEARGRVGRALEGIGTSA